MGELLSESISYIENNLTELALVPLDEAVHFFEEEWEILEEFDAPEFEPDYNIDFWSEADTWLKAGME